MAVGAIIGAALGIGQQLLSSQNDKPEIKATKETIAARKDVIAAYPEHLRAHTNMMYAAFADADNQKPQVASSYEIKNMVASLKESQERLARSEKKSGGGLFGRLLGVATSLIG